MKGVGKESELIQSGRFIQSLLTLRLLGRDFEEYVDVSFINDLYRRIT
jgi:hypothetical protein